LKKNGFVKILRSRSPVKWNFTLRAIERSSGVRSGSAVHLFSSGEEQTQ
jgi:hypothetical protein